MKISLIVEHSQVTPHALLTHVTCLLNTWGVSVKQITPEQCYLNLAHIQPTAVLYLLASSTPLALSLAGVLHSLGAVLINPYPVANALHNKLIGLRILQAHGLPVPETYAISNLAHIKDLLTSGPLIIKPQLGSDCQEEHIVHDLNQFYRMAPLSTPILAQRCYEPCEQGRMIYCIGGQLLGVNQRRTTPHTSTAADSQLFATCDLYELAARCSQAFDIDLFGIKVVEHKGVLYVVDMVSFPDFAEEPEAAPRLAEYLYARAQFLNEKKRES